MDTSLAILRRKLAGLSMSQADANHIHHLAKRSLGGVKRAVLARIVSQVRMVWLVHSCGTLYFVCARVLIRAYAHGSLCVLSVHTRVRQVLEEQGQRRTPVDYRKMMDETPSGSVDVYVRCAKLLLLKRLDSLAACEPLLYLCAQ